MAYIGNSPSYGLYKKLDSISAGFNGVTTTFNLAVASTPVTAGTAQNLLVSISGVLQEPGSAYTVSGSTITFSEAPVATDTFFGVLLGSVGEVTAVTDDTITTAKIVNGAVVLTTKVTGILPLANGGTGSTALKTINSEAITGSGDIPLQTPLVSGTSIKTVNSTSLLGSGDIVVQPSLVSGTNIKTVNSTSLLGSGNITIGAVPTGVYLNKLVTQSTTTFVVPANISSIRAYVGGKGGDGAYAVGNIAAGGGGGGFAFGTIATTPGETLNIDITAGVAKLKRGATVLLHGNPGTAGAGGIGGGGGTGSKDASVTSGGTSTGGSGGSATTWHAGGGSAGSPLGNGYPGGSANSGVYYTGGGGGIGGAGGPGIASSEMVGGGGGGAGGATDGTAGGGAGGSSVTGIPGIGRVIPFSDPLLAPLIGCGAAASITSTSGLGLAGQHGGPGGGGSGSSGAAMAGNGGFGGGGGGGGAGGGHGGIGGELGGGGGGAMMVPNTTGSSSLACGGGGGGGNFGGIGGPATVWIFY